MRGVPEKPVTASPVVTGAELRAVLGRKVKCGAPHFPDKDTEAPEKG